MEAFSVKLKNSRDSSVITSLRVTLSRDEVKSLDSSLTSGWSTWSTWLSFHGRIAQSTPKTFSFLANKSYTVGGYGYWRRDHVRVSHYLRFRANAIFTKDGEFDLDSFFREYNPHRQTRISLTIQNASSDEQQLYCYESPSGVPICYGQEWFCIFDPGESLTLDLPRNKQTIFKVLRRSGENWRELTRVFTMNETIDLVDVWSRGKELLGGASGGEPKMPDPSGKINLPDREDDDLPVNPEDDLLVEDDLHEDPNRVTITLRNLLPRKVIQYKYKFKADVDSFDSDSEDEGYLGPREVLQKRFLLNKSYYFRFQVGNDVKHKSRTFTQEEDWDLDDIFN